MSEFLKETFVGSMPLDPTDRLFRSPSRLFFECRGIPRAVPVKIDKIEVRLDFHVYPIIDFDLLIGSPFENFLREKSSQGSSGMISGKLLSPLLSPARKIQWWSIMTTKTYSKRRCLHHHSFLQTLLLLPILSMTHFSRRKSGRNGQIE